MREVDVTELLKTIKNQYEEVTKHFSSSSSSSSSLPRALQSFQHSLSLFFNQMESSSSKQTSISALDCLLSRDLTWFSVSSFKSGLLKDIGTTFLELASKHSNSVALFCSIFIKIGCLVFQWNKTDESLPHAILFVALFDHLLGHLGDIDRHVLSFEIKEIMLRETKITVKSLPNVAETRLFMLLCFLKASISWKCLYTQEILINMIYYSFQMKDAILHKKKDETSEAISCRLHRIFADDGGKASRLSKVAQQWSLDISSRFHRSDVEYDCENVFVDRDCRKQMLRPSSASQSVKAWVLKDLHIWINIRKELFFSKFSVLIPQFVAHWGRDTRHLSSQMIKSLLEELAPFTEKVVGSLYSRKYINHIDISRKTFQWLNSLLYVLVAAASASPSLYTHKILLELRNIVTNYYSVSCSRNLHETVKALYGAKVGCYLISAMTSHFTYVSFKDIAASIKFLCDMTEKSHEDHKDVGMTKKASSDTINLRKIFFMFFSSYLAYSLIHRCKEIQREIHSSDSVSLRNALFNTFEDSITSSYCSCTSNVMICDCKSIHMTHPYLATQLCLVFLPRLGISCNVTNQGVEYSFKAKQWYDEQCESQQHAFSCDDLRSLDLSQLLPYSRQGYRPADVFFAVEQWATDATNIHHDFGRDVNLKSTTLRQLENACHDVYSTHVASSPDKPSRRFSDINMVFSFDICVIIMGFISQKRVCRLACVNKQFSLAAACPLVWVRKYVVKYGSLFDMNPKAAGNKTMSGGLSDEKVAGVSCHNCYPDASDQKTKRRHKACCNGLSNNHNWLKLYQVYNAIIMHCSLLNSAFPQDMMQHSRIAKKMQKRGLPSPSTVCPVVGCLHIYRTEKQKEV